MPNWATLDQLSITWMIVPRRKADFISADKQTTAGCMQHRFWWCCESSEYNTNNIENLSIWVKRLHRITGHRSRSSPLGWRREIWRWHRRFIDNIRQGTKSTCRSDRVMANCIMRNGNGLWLSGIAENVLFVNYIAYICMFSHNVWLGSLPVTFQDLWLQILSQNTLLG